jgi:hypothetical protein
MRQYRRVLAAFAAGETTATYTEQILNEDGSVCRETSGLTAFRMAGAAAMDLLIPSGIAVGVNKIQFQKAMVLGGTFTDARDVYGSLITAPKTETAQTAKGDIVMVNPEMFASFLVKLLPVDSGGSAIAPGAVTFEIALKD